MKIFRPIGDFFGFFLRPIFVYLLRKFIIPFYQTYLPLMQELGQTLGETVVGWLELIFGVLNIFKDNSPTSELLKGVQGSVDAINPQLLSDTELITAAIEKSKLNSKDLMGDWQRFAEQLFPNQDVKGWDIGGKDDSRKNIPLTQEAVDYYRKLGVQVVPHLDSAGRRFETSTNTFSTATQQFAATVGKIGSGASINGNQQDARSDRGTDKKIIIITTEGDVTNGTSDLSPEDQDDADAALESTKYKRGRWS